MHTWLSHARARAHDAHGISGAVDCSSLSRRWVDCHVLCMDTLPESLHVLTNMLHHGSLNNHPCSQGKDNEAKAEALKKSIMMLLNGEEFPTLFITLVRYVLPCDDHQVQKLLLLYLEMIEKTDESGKLLPEMILICQNLRNNLQHPNEYIRGVTLRFLTRITEVSAFTQTHAYTLAPSKTLLPPCRAVSPLSPHPSLPPTSSDTASLP